MFREIRRKDRILDNELAIRLLEEAEYGFLAMSGINGYGYGIPINYVKEGDSIYFHCAPEGYKLECLRENPKVSFTVVGATQIVPGNSRQVTRALSLLERCIWICRKKSVGMPCGYS